MYRQWHHDKRYRKSSHIFNKQGFVPCLFVTLLNQPSEKYLVSIHVAMTLVNKYITLVFTMMIINIKH